MGTKVLCTKCGLPFSSKGIKLHKLFCKPESVAVCTDEVHNDAHPQPESVAVSTDEANNEVHDEAEESPGGSLLGAVIAIFAFIVGVAILGYFWLKSKNKSNTKTDPGLTSPAPAVSLTNLSMVGKT